MSDITVIGHLDPRLAEVGEVLRQSIDQGGDLGAQVTVVVDGQVLADLAAGFQDRARTLPYTPETLTCVFSSGKAVCAALVLAAVSSGTLCYDTLISEVWPEFVGGGKETLTLAEVMSHQSGLSGFAEEQPTDIWLRWEESCSAIAAMDPLFPPRSASGYAPQTFGYMVGEVLRRSAGKSVGAQLRLITDDIVCGLSLAQATRAAPLVKPRQAPNLGDVTDLKRAAFLKPWSAASGVSRQAWAAAEIPASNMHASARGLATMMQLFASGQMGDGLKASGEAREQSWAERINGDDLVLPLHISWAAGLMRETGGLFGAPPTAIGHYGFGGSCVLADPARSLSFAYVPNQQSHHLVSDPRAVRLVEAVYRAL